MPVDDQQPCQLAAAVTWLDRRAPYLPTYPWMYVTTSYR